MKIQKNKTAGRTSREQIYDWLIDWGFYLCDDREDRAFFVAVMQGICKKLDKLPLEEIQDIDEVIEGLTEELQERQGR